MTIELEPSGDAARYLTMDRVDLRRYAEALKRCLLLLRVEPGDILAYFEFGTSPVVYLSSSCYVPYLRRGAAEALGCITICNDGVATMSDRAVEILRYVRPRFFFVRVDCLFPFVSACERTGIQASRYVEALVVTQNDGGVPRGLLERSSDSLGVPIYRLPRCDEALFFAPECPECRCLHTWPEMYRVELAAPGTLDAVPSGQRGLLRVSNRFVRSRPRSQVLTALEGQLAEGSCPRGPEDLRLYP